MSIPRHNPDLESWVGADDGEWPQPDDLREHSRRIAATRGHPYECLDGCLRCEIDDDLCPRCESDPCLCEDEEDA